MISRNNKTILSVLRQWTSLFSIKELRLYAFHESSETSIFRSYWKNRVCYLVKTTINYLKFTIFVHRASWRSFSQSLQTESGIVTRSCHNQFYFQILYNWLFISHHSSFYRVFRAQADWTFFYRRNFLRKTCATPEKNAATPHLVLRSLLSLRNEHRV
jgi:hypothetical protein